MSRNIVLVTGSRSEYGLLRPIALALRNFENVEYGFAVTGCHLVDDYGRTAELVKEEGCPVWGEVPMYETLGGGFEQLPGALARGVLGLQKVLTERKADMVLVLGDRLEALAGALAGYFKRLAVAHVHGGETTDHHMDDSTRHAITRFAHLHFPATERSAERLRRMGEEPWRIHRCGAPGLDDIAAAGAPPKEELLARFGLDCKRPFVILLFHPETSAYLEAGSQVRCILEALRDMGVGILALYPNGDPGSELIVQELKRFEAEAPAGSFFLAQHLKRKEFLQALKTADALVGNSSCGLIEASFTKTPTLNVGQRNRNREHGANVRFVPVEKQAIARALREILSPAFRSSLSGAPCPWGDGRAGERIARVLAEVRLDDRLLSKRLTL